MKILAPAKINLCLDIVKKTPSGYHEIQTVFHELPDLADELEITDNQQSDQLSIAQAPLEKASNRLIKTENHLALKALKLIKNELGITKCVHIKIQKNIPVAAGLGGDSSDAAAVLKALNLLWKLELSKEKLAELAAQLGMDVPFFIYGGTSLGTNLGERIRPLKPIKGLKFTLNPKQNWASLPITSDKPKSATMYQSLELNRCGQNLTKTESVLKGIETSDPELILKNLHNDFETIAKTAPGLHLSGSGPATFSISRI